MEIPGDPGRLFRETRGPEDLPCCSSAPSSDYDGKESCRQPPSEYPNTLDRATWTLRLRYRVILGSETLYAEMPGHPGVSTCSDRVTVRTGASIPRYRGSETLRTEMRGIQGFRRVLTELSGNPGVYTEIPGICGAEMLQLGAT